MFRRLEVGQLVKYWFPLSFIFAPSWQSVPPKINERVERDFSNIFAFKSSNPFRNLFTGPESDSCLASCQSVRHWVRALFETWLMWPWRVKIHAILPYLTSCNVQEMLNMQNMQSVQNLQTKPTKPNLPNKTCQTKPTKPNLPNQTCQTKPTKPNLPNQTYQTKPNLPNKT